jgi:hypothetical protein
MSLVHNLASSFHSINQEPGANPGAPLSPLMAILYFVGGPLMLFLVISGVVALLTTKKKSNR